MLGADPHPHPPTDGLQQQWLVKAARAGLSDGGMHLPWAAAFLSRRTIAHESVFAAASLVACAHSFIGI